MSEIEHIEGFIVEEWDSDKIPTGDSKFFRDKEEAIAYWRNYGGALKPYTIHWPRGA